MTDVPGAASREHRVGYTVYYEDTDALGIVYHANYLRYLERGRTEFLADHGLPVADLNARGVLVVVHSLEITFRRPVGLGDRIEVVSRFTLPTRFKGVFEQRVESGGRPAATARVVVACTSPDRRLIAFPDDLRRLAEGGEQTARG